MFGNLSCRSQPLKRSKFHYFEYMLTIELGNSKVVNNESRTFV